MNETLNFWGPVWGNSSTNVFAPEAAPTFDQFPSQTVQQQPANVMKSPYLQTQSPIQPMDMSGFNGLGGDSLTWNGLMDQLGIQNKFAAQGQTPAQTTF